MFQVILRRGLRAGVVLAAAAAIVVSFQIQGTSAATSTSVSEAQTLMTSLGIPTGPIDGTYGPLTGRGLCVARQLAGLPLSRTTVDSTVLARLKTWSNTYGNLTKMPAKSYNGAATFVLVNQTCQTLTYVENNKVVRILPVSTGRDSSTKNGDLYLLGATQKGWFCWDYIKAQEPCTTTSTKLGNMYNIRPILNNNSTGTDTYLYGSFTGAETTPYYPTATNGGIRLTTADMDWMYQHVGNNGMPRLAITGAYQQ